VTKATMKATATATTIEMTDSSMTEILTGDPLVGVLKQISKCPRDLAFRCAGGGRGSGTQLIKSRKDVNGLFANETVTKAAIPGMKLLHRLLVILPVALFTEVMEADLGPSG